MLFFVLAALCALLAALGVEVVGPVALLPLAVAFLALGHLPWATIRRPLG